MNKNINNLFLMAILISSVILVSCSNDDNPAVPTINNSGTFTDSRDSNTYKWVEIGEQVWMAENLAYKPNSGNYWAINNNDNNIPIFGYLYDWDIAQTIAPAGWHLPSQEEWQLLVNYLGGSDKAFSKLLEEGTVHWKTPNNATNESKFTALPTGYFDQRDNSFNGFSYLTMFHSSTEYSGNNSAAMGLLLNQNFLEASIEGRPKELALPIRCIKN